MCLIRLLAVRFRFGLVFRRQIRLAKLGTCKMKVVLHRPRPERGIEIASPSFVPKLE